METVYFKIYNGAKQVDKEKSINTKCMLEKSKLLTKNTRDSQKAEGRNYFFSAEVNIEIKKTKGKTKNSWFDTIDTFTNFCLAAKQTKQKLEMINVRNKADYNSIHYQMMTKFHKR